MNDTQVFGTYTSAQSILMALNAALALIPMGSKERTRTYQSSNYRDVDVAGVSAHAPDGTERWCLAIVGGARPEIELTMWHDVEAVCLAFTPSELAAMDRANAAMAGLLVSGLKRYRDHRAESLITALDDRHDLVLQTTLVEMAS